MMLVCVTMYNEDESLLKKTLDGIESNLPEFKKYNISSN